MCLTEPAHSDLVFGQADKELHVFILIPTIQAHVNWLQLRAELFLGLRAVVGFGSSLLCALFRFTVAFGHQSPESSQAIKDRARK